MRSFKLVAVFAVLGLACGDSGADGGNGGTSDNGGSSNDGGTSNAGGNATQGGGGSTTNFGGMPNGGNGTGGTTTDGGNGTGGSIQDGGNGTGGSISDGGNGTGGNATGGNGTGGNGTGGGAFAFCDDINSCNGDGMDPESGCPECAILGDASTASDGGSCSDEYIGCFGTSGTCLAAEGGLPDCCDLYDCFAVCDPNNNGIDTQQEFDCFCANDGLSCDAQQPPGTCLGDHPTGFSAALEWEGCVFDDVCAVSCGNPPPPPACDSIGTCAGDGINADSGCFECSVLGDTQSFSDGGACADEYQACYGTSGTCLAAEGGNPDCCALQTCIDNCDLDNDGTVESGAELNCVCGNNGTQCTSLGTNTCLSNHQVGLGFLQEVQTCLYDDVCPVSCN